MLDLVRGQAKWLAGSINASDRAKLDEYLTAIREAEARIQGIGRWPHVPKPEVGFDDSVDAHGSMDYATLSPLMFDLLFLAIQSDSSRVFTAGFGRHNHVIELDGVTDGYHGITHHGNLPERLKQLRIIDAFYIEQMARFMAKLKNARTDHRNLLEGQGELDDYALANRLSYFLWSTMPDAELFALARSGRLKEPTILQQQATRLLEDKRSERFCNSFADQWLSLDTLGSMPPDVKIPQFKDYFRDKLEPAMLEETHRYFRHVLQENRSVRDFIDSDYSFVNKGLAKLYDVVEFAGIPEHDKTRTRTGGTQGILANLTGAKTVRDLLEKHRNDTACMECHRRMDPLGFALEAYDPIGRLRTEYSPKQTVTTHGTFMGKDFADVKELKQILATDIRPFARNLVIRIAEYATSVMVVSDVFLRKL